jgi:hypothetical protein
MTGVMMKRVRGCLWFLSVTSMCCEKTKGQMMTMRLDA